MGNEDNMTRVQAICACRNIVQLCEENERVPEDMASGIRDRAESMEKRITDNAQYPNITPGMDNALRNMWSGLRKWDRDDKFNDDLFADLDAVAEEIADLDASAGNKPAPKGRETGDVSEELAKKYEGRTKEPTKEPPLPSTTTAATLSLSEVLRRKESAVGFVLDEIHKAAITVLNKAVVRSLALADVLGMTKSDRTQQLIRAAYYVGVLRGIGLLHSKLQNGGE